MTKKYICIADNGPFIDNPQQFIIEAKSDPINDPLGYVHLSSRVHHRDQGIFTVANSKELALGEYVVDLCHRLLSTQTTPTIGKILHRVVPIEVVFDGNTWTKVTKLPPEYFIGQFEIEVTELGNYHCHIIAYCGIDPDEPIEEYLNHLPIEFNFDLPGHFYN